MKPQHTMKQTHHDNQLRESSESVTRGNREIQQSAVRTRRTTKRDLAGRCVRSFMLLLILVCGLASTNAFAGPIILGGDDLDLHGSYASGANQKGWLYIEKALASMYRDGCITRPGNDGSIAVLGAAFSTAATGGNAGAAAHYAGSVALSKTVNYYDLAGGINQFFIDLSSGAVRPAIIYIPSSDFDAVGGISTTEGAALTAHAADLQSFVNSGGGLMAHIDGSNTSGWVTTVTGVTVTTGCNSVGATLTAAGNTAFPALSDSNINSTAGPCHATFSGSLGGLSVLALDGSSPKRNVIIGGGCGTTIGASSCAEFSATTTCQGTSTEFTDLSTGATSWNWNFGDTTSSTQQSPTHTYSVPGTYNVTLSVNGGACAVTHTVTVTAPPPAPIIAGPTSTCGKTATYCITRTPGVTYTWSVTNGTMTAPTITATQICITVTWNATGNGMVTVKATSADTCCSSIAKLFVKACEDYCCDGIKGNAVSDKDPVSLGGGLYTITPTLSASANIIRVTATVISSSQAFTAGSCGTGGPVNSYLVPPLSNVLGFTSSLSVSNGREEIWSSSSGVNLSSGVAFPFNIQFPPVGTCPDIIRFCVKYTFTDEKCRTCEIIRCYEVVRTAKGGLPD